MIVSETVWTVECDSCGALLLDHDVVTDRGHARQLAAAAGWLILDDGEAYCPECVAGGIR